MWASARRGSNASTPNGYGTVASIRLLASPQRRHRDGPLSEQAHRRRQIARSGEHPVDTWSRSDVRCAVDTDRLAGRLTTRDRSRRRTPRAPAYVVPRECTARSCARVPVRRPSDIGNCCTGTGQPPRIMALIDRTRPSRFRYGARVLHSANQPHERGRVVRHRPPVVRARLPMLCGSRERHLVRLSDLRPGPQ